MFTGFLFGYVYLYMCMREGYKTFLDFYEQLYSKGEKNYEIERGIRGCKTLPYHLWYKDIKLVSSQDWRVFMLSLCICVRILLFFLCSSKPSWIAGRIFFTWLQTDPRYIWNKTTVSSLRNNCGMPYTLFVLFRILKLSIYYFLVLHLSCTKYQ